MAERYRSTIAHARRVKGEPHVHQFEEAE